MNRTARFAIIGFVSGCVVAGSLALAIAPQSSDEKQPPGEPEFELPPGWTMADVMKAVEAGEPGEMHEFLAKSLGEWEAATTMWMAPGVEPMRGEGTSTVTKLMGGRFYQVEFASEWPGLGPYSGLGLFGYDNVAGTFQTVWIEDHSTGMSFGTGELSEDGQTLTWELTYSCPIRGEPVTAKQTERITGEGKKTLEMHTSCPKTGENFKMMEIAFTRKSE